MKLLLEHFFIASFVGCLGWFISGDIYCVASALAAGWCIDADHALDFMLWSIKSKKINLQLIKTGEYFKKNNKIIVPFHAWEFTILLFSIAYFNPNQRAILLSAAIAHGLHLFQDQYSYRVRFLGYLFISRLSTKFSRKGFCRHGVD